MSLGYISVVQAGCRSCSEILAVGHTCNLICQGGAVEPAVAVTDRRRIPCKVNALAVGCRGGQVAYHTRKVAAGKCIDAVNDTFHSGLSASRHIICMLAAGGIFICPCHFLADLRSVGRQNRHRFTIIRITVHAHFREILEREAVPLLRGVGPCESNLVLAIVVNAVVQVLHTGRSRACVGCDIRYVQTDDCLV